MPVQNRVSVKKHSAPRLDFLARNKKPLLFLALLLYLYFRGIGDHGLFDPLEGVNASIPLTMLARGGYFIPRVGDSLCAGKALGTWWLSSFSLSVFGWTEFAVRFWPALAGLGMALAAVLAVGGQRRAWLTASVSASMVLGFAVSQIASSHALYACCTGFAMAAFIRVGRLLPEVGESPLARREERRWILLAHAASLAAFIVHGPEGIILPWLTLLSFSILTRRFGVLRACLTWWPAVAVSALGTVGCLLLQWLENPVLLRFLFFESPKFLAPSGKLVLAFLLMGTVPWPGFLLRAAWEAVPRTRAALLARDEVNSGFFMVFWAFLFAFFALLMGDPLALAASVPALAALTGGALDRWLEAEPPDAADPAQVSPVQIAVAVNILILVPVLIAGLPLLLRAFPFLRGAMLSLVPWAIFTVIFLFATWHYARSRRDPAAWPRQMEKLARNGAAVALLCLMPLAGVFDLAAEQGSIRDIGLTLRGAVGRDDTVIQYAVNRPSLYFYILHSYTLVNSPQLSGVASKGLIRSDTALHNAWARKERAFLLIPQKQQPLSPLPEDVYNIMEANGMLLLSNRPGLDVP